MTIEPLPLAHCAMVCAPVGEGPNLLAKLADSSAIAGYGILYVCIHAQKRTTDYYKILL